MSAPDELKPENLGPYYFDGISYIFEKEADGNSRMICEVRGVGDGKFQENADLLIKALNGNQSHIRKGMDAMNEEKELVEALERISRADRNAGASYGWCATEAAAALSKYRSRGVG